MDLAAEIRKDLHNRFAQGNIPRIFQFRKEISILTQSSNSISVFYLKLKGL